MTVRTAFAVFCDAEDCQDMQFTMSPPSSEAALSELGYERRDGRDLCSFCKDRRA